MSDDRTIQLAPSLLASDFADLGGAVAMLDDIVDVFHVDIMDGHFVPNLTFGPPVVTRLAKHCRIPLDAHLMVDDPDALLPQLAEQSPSVVASQPAGQQPSFGPQLLIGGLSQVA